MEATLVKVLAFALTVVVTGAIGFVVARKYTRPDTAATWIILILFVLVAPYIGRSVRLISISEFYIRLCWTLQGLAIGLLAGRLWRLTGNRRGDTPKS